MISCMGGWCDRRGSCAYYWRSAPITLERLCEPGNTDAYDRIRPGTQISLSREVGDQVSAEGSGSLYEVARYL